MQTRVARAGSRLAQRSGVARGVRYAGGGEPRRAQAARITADARKSQPVRLVARYGHAVIHSHRDALADDLGFGEADQRRLDLEAAALDTGLGGEPREALERGDEFRAAVRIARVI